MTKIGSKCQKHAPARGRPNPAEGRPRVEGEGECFAPLIFILKYVDFSSNVLIFSLKILEIGDRKKCQKSLKFPKLEILHFLVTHFCSGPRLPVVKLASYSSS